MSCDHFCVIIDWPMPIDANWLTRHRLSSIDFPIIGFIDCSSPVSFNPPWRHFWIAQASFWQGSPLPPGISIVELLSCSPLQHWAKTLSRNVYFFLRNLTRHDLRHVDGMTGIWVDFDLGYDSSHRNEATDSNGITFFNHMWSTLLVVVRRKTVCSCFC